MAKLTNRLTPATVRKLGVGLHPDGDGVYLQCTTGASGDINRSWIFRFSRDGKERRMGLGKYRGNGAADDVTLAVARERAAACRQLLANGQDPLDRREAERRSAGPQATVTFKDAFYTYFAGKRQSLSNAKHRAQWESTLQTYAFPLIGHRPVADVTAGEVIDALRPIWTTRPETARRVLQRISAVFESAITRELRVKGNPCVGVVRELGKRGSSVVHHRSMPYRQVPGFVARLRDSGSWPATRLALEWLILTATRSGETRLARWGGEVDEGRALWTVPAERMKAKRPHVVPLPPRCIEILQALRGVYPAEAGGWLFPSMHHGKPLSDMTLTKVLRDMGAADIATVHGFRSSFKVWSAEIARVRDEVSEAALAHVVPEKVRAAYLRTAFLDERRDLMVSWSNYITWVA